MDDQDPDITRDEPTGQPPLDGDATIDGPANGPSSIGGDAQSPHLPQIEGYRIIGQLGEGGMGTVWRAVQLSTDREIALKLMSGTSMWSDRAKARFEREVKLAARLEHSNIATIYDSGLHRGVYYYAMQLVDGLPLSQFMLKHKPSTKATIKLMMIVAKAVDSAHEHGVVHRDLKPDNIVVTAKGKPYVVDFGLAKNVGDEDRGQTLSIDGDVSGTLAYMSPEQAAGQIQDINHRTDVFALGAILYRLLTGQTPHDMTGPMHKIMGRICEDPVREPSQFSGSVDADLQAILLKALAHDQEERYPSAVSFAQALKGYLVAQQSQPAAPPAKPPREPSAITVAPEADAPPPKAAKHAEPDRPIPVARVVRRRETPEPSKRKAGPKLLVAGVAGLAAVGVVLAVLLSGPGVDPPADTDTPPPITPDQVSGSVAPDQPPPPPSVSLGDDVGGTVRVLKISNLGHEINGYGQELAPAISRDGLTLVFAREREGKSSLWWSRRETVDAPFGKPEEMDPQINASGSEGHPALSADGLRLVFSSSRPGSLGSDLWEARREKVDQPFESPARLPDAILSDTEDMAPSFAEGGKSLYFSTNRGGPRTSWHIYRAQRPSIDVPFSTSPEVVVRHAGDPVVSANGKVMIMTSWRGNGGHGGADLWMCQRDSTDEPFGEPINLGSEINTASNEGSPSLSADGKTLYFESNRPGGKGFDLWKADLRWGTAEPVVGQTPSAHTPDRSADLSGKPRVIEVTNLGPGVNGPRGDGQPAISADGLTLVIASYRPGSAKSDLWWSQRESVDGPFGELVNLGTEINSQFNEFQPALSSDGLTLAFSSDRTPRGGRWNQDIFICRRESLDEPFGPAKPSGMHLPAVGSDQSPTFLGNDTLIFDSQGRGSGKATQLWSASRSDAKAPFQNLERVPGTGDYDKGTIPAISADGKVLVLTAKWKGGFGEEDLWYARRDSLDEPFGEPINLGPEINTPYREGSPFLSADGKTLYFDSNRPGGQGDDDVWQARLVWGDTEPLDTPGHLASDVGGVMTIGAVKNLGPTVNTNEVETSSEVSRDGLTLVFSSDGGRGRRFDLWIAQRKSVDEPFGQAVNLGPKINTPLNEVHPALSPDGLRLVYSSGQYNKAQHDLYECRRASTDEPFGPPTRLGNLCKPGRDQTAPAFGADSTELFFQHGLFKQEDPWTIVRVTRPTPDSPFSKDEQTILENAVEPYLSANGKVLLFAGWDQGAIADDGPLRLWMCQREDIDKPFGKRIKLGPEVNGAVTSQSPTLSGDGKTLYFHAVRPGGQGKMDIWQAEVRWDGTKPIAAETPILGKLAVTRITNLGPVINSQGRDLQPNISADGLTLVWSRKPNGTQNQDLWWSRRDSLDEPFSGPTSLGALVNSTATEEQATLSPDGLVLVFSSNRKGSEGADLWQARRESPDQPFGPAQRLGDAIQSPRRDQGAVFLGDANTLYFFSSREMPGDDGRLRWRLFRAVRPAVDEPFQTPVVALDNLWDNLHPACPTFSADGKVLIFGARGNKGFGDYDLWLCQRDAVDQPFSEPVNLGPDINTVAAEGGPSLSSDGRTLYFNSNRPGGEGGADLWQADLSWLASDTVAVASASGPRLVSASEATNLGPLINSPGIDGQPTLSADGLTLILMSNRSGRAQEDLWWAKRERAEDPFGKPVKMGSNINSSANENQPALSPDGLMLVFGSSRQKNRRWATGLWVATRGRVDAPFGQATRLDIEQAQSETGAAFLDSNTLLFDSYGRGSPKWSLQTIDRPSVDDPFGEARSVEGVDTQQHLTLPALWADGKIIIFSSLRGGGFGGEDLWYARRDSVDKPFGEPINLGPGINTEHNETSAAISADGKTLLFDSDRPGGEGNWDLYQATLTWQNAEVAATDFSGTPKASNVTNLGPTVNTAGLDGQPEISRDGLSLLLMSQREGGGGRDLWLSRRDSVDEPFGKPVNMGINTDSTEGDPALSPDGLTLIFNSRRPGGQGDADLWQVRRPRRDAPFGPAKHMDDLFQSGTTEMAAAFGTDATSLYYVSRVGGGGSSWRIWHTRRDSVDKPFEKPVTLAGPIHDTGNASAPFLLDNERVIVFTSTREGGFGGEDLWYARRDSVDEPFGEPVNLGPEINTRHNEGSATVSADGKTIYFNSDRPGGQGGWDIWQATLTWESAQPQP